MKYKLSDIAELRNQRTEVSPLSRDTYISTENMLPNRGGIVAATSLPTMEYTQAYCAGDVLVSNIRPYFKKIWRANFEGGCSNDVLVFHAKQGVDSRYLYYVLADDLFFEYATKTARGSKMPRGDKTAIMNYPVEGHSYAEQRKIASVLAAIDEKIINNRAINDNLAA